MEKGNAISLWLFFLSPTIIADFILLFISFYFILAISFCFAKAITVCFTVTI